MNKRRIIAILIAFLLTVAATAMWSASTIEREGDPDVNVLEASFQSIRQPVQERRQEDPTDDGEGCREVCCRGS